VARIGVDIEAVRPEFGDLEESTFTSRELAQFSAFPHAVKSLVFFRAWVAKEAYLKATGEGLEGGLTSLELDLTSSQDVRPRAIGGDTSNLSSWKFQGFDVGEAIVGAVAIESESRVDVSIQHINVGDEKLVL